MKILWFTWKDRKNPLAGGAEFINEELAERLVRDGHQVIFLVGGFPGGTADETTAEGYRIIRLGNRWTAYWHAQRYYRENLRGWADLIIEEINTIPFLTQFYTARERRVLLIYQLCREIWFYEMFFPLNILGYLLEPLYLFLLRKNHCITESESTRRDLIRFGFDTSRIHVIPVCIDMEPARDPGDTDKYPEPTVLSLGAMRSMKRTVHQIEAFNLAKKDLPDLRLIVAGGGSGRYRNKVMRAIARSPYRDDIDYLGSIDASKKSELMRRSHLILVASVKEGWGLIVTEAASQGTPAVAYDVDGLRDSVQDGLSGLLCKGNSPVDMARQIVALLNDDRQYELMSRKAWELSKEYTPGRCYHGFLDVLRSLDPRF